MLTINFYPDSDFWDLGEAVEKYRSWWKKDASKIIKSIEGVSGLKFRETYINAVVFRARFSSQSFPLSLRADVDDTLKVAILIHELCHRLVVGNGVKLLKLGIKTEEGRILERHKVVDLILYDIWVDLYGKKFADKAVLAEANSQKTNVYKKAWKWALSMSMGERQKLFAVCKK